MIVQSKIQGPIIEREKSSSTSYNFNPKKNYEIFLLLQIVERVTKLKKKKKKQTFFVLKPVKKKKKNR